MKIDIPESINCGHCPFCYGPCGNCSLADALYGWERDNSNSLVAEWANNGWRESKDVKCRPYWCPFEPNNEE